MKIHRNRRSRRGGFSLAELMVVIVIIGLLATIVVPNVFRNLSQANITKAKADIDALNNAVVEYKINNGNRAPDSLSALLEPDPMTNEPYLTSTSIPVDPWGNEYQYDPPSGSDDYDIYSLGKDGEVGGEGANRDLHVKDLQASGN